MAMKKAENWIIFPTRPKSKKSILQLTILEFKIRYFAYFSFSVSDEETKIDKEMKGVSDESALRKLLTSDEEEEEENPEEKKEENGNKSDQEEQPPKDEEPQSSSAVKKKKKKEVPSPSKSGSGDAPVKEGELF